MRTLVRRLMVLVAMAAPAALPAQDRATVAVLPFENGGSHGRDREEFEALRVGIAALFATELGRHPGVALVDRDRVRALLAEHGAADRIDAGTAARLGRQAGARFVVAGTFIDLYGDFRVDARIIDVNRGEVLVVVRSDPKLSDRRQMFRIVQSVAERVTEGTGLPPLPAAQAQAARARSLPAEAVVQFSLGLAAEDRGEAQRAADFYARALAAAADFPEAREALRRVRGG
jgi:TolB-like protein